MFRSSLWWITLPVWCLWSLPPKDQLFFNFTGVLSEIERIWRFATPVPPPTRSSGSIPASYTQVWWHLPELPAANLIFALLMHFASGFKSLYHKVIRSQKQLSIQRVAALRLDLFIQFIGCVPHHLFIIVLYSHPGKVIPLKNTDQQEINVSIFRTRNIISHWHQMYTSTGTKGFPCP